MTQKHITDMTHEQAELILEIGDTLHQVGNIISALIETVDKLKATNHSNRDYTELGMQISSVLMAITVPLRTATTIVTKAAGEDVEPPKPEFNINEKKALAPLFEHMDRMLDSMKEAANALMTLENPRNNPWVSNFASELTRLIQASITPLSMAKEAREVINEERSKPISKLN